MPNIVRSLDKVSLMRVKLDVNLPETIEPKIHRDSVADRTPRSPRNRRRAPTLAHAEGLA